jgi:hypothetical protein
MTNSLEPDDCCGWALSKALVKGKLDHTDTWTHKKCGTEWRCTIVGGMIRHWSPVSIAQVW